MKFLKSISLFCVILICGILIGIYATNNLNSHESKDENLEEEAKIKLTQEETLPVNTTKQITTCDTVYLVRSCENGKEPIVKQEAIPFYFMGLNKEELIDAVADYEKAPSFNDLEKGFVSMQLISFHPDKITVEKQYEVQEKETVYYLKLENNEIVAYRSDDENVFMTTDLVMDELPDDVQQDIIQIKCFNNLEALYDFLESYTS